MKVNQSTNTSESLKSTRDGFGQGIVQAADHNSNIVALCADLTDSMRLSAFKQKYPERFIQTGVAEQNMMSIAAGLALKNKIPFASSFAVFNPMRNLDQLRVGVCYSNLNVKIIGGHAGLVTGQDGATHQCLEDLAITRTLPNMQVIVPCDYNQAISATLAISKAQGPCYLRLSRPKTPIITHLNNNFRIGKADVMRKGTDITIFSCGHLVHTSLEVAKLLDNNNQLSCRVINMHTIKPLDKKVIIKAANQTKYLISLEDHQIHAGLGSAIAEILSQEVNQSIEAKFKFKIIGVEDQFGESGKAEQLMKKYNLDQESIYNTILQLINSSN